MMRLVIVYLIILVVVVVFPHVHAVGLRKRTYFGSGCIGALQIESTNLLPAGSCVPVPCFDSGAGSFVTDCPATVTDPTNLAIRYLTYDAPLCGGGVIVSVSAYSDACVSSSSTSSQFRCNSVGGLTTAQLDGWSSTSTCTGTSFCAQALWNDLPLGCSPDGVNRSRKYVCENPTTISPLCVNTTATGSTAILVTGPTILTTTTTTTPVSSSASLLMTTTTSFSFSAVLIFCITINWVY